MSNVDFDSIEFVNRKMRDVVATARAAAAGPANLLIVGAAGTGKTSLARWIHRQGTPNRPLIVLSVRDLRDRAGDVAAHVREARGGTLLVEDVDLASTAVQNALAEAYEGAANEAPRLIGTSRRELRSLARQDLFRQDLYYRMTVLTIEIPSLDQREEDLDGLVGFMTDVAGILHGKRGLSISAEAREKLLGRSWPGNVRELENVIERAVALTGDGVIRGEHIVFEKAGPAAAADFGPGMSLSEVEKRLILQTLELTAQNRTRAAQLLGISIRTLRNKLNEYREAGMSGSDPSRRADELVR